MTPIAIVGVGKIARDQHVPAISRSGEFELAATVSIGPGVDGVPHFGSLDEMAAAVPEVSAVAICTPPGSRLELVERATMLGLDMLLEKPPAATLADARQIVAAAEEAGRVLYLSWHSREAAAVEPARAWLNGREVTSARIRWKEDVRVWHPGQEWIWDPGVGVFDPGINALSVLTELLDQRLFVRSSRLEFPANRDAPIAAHLELSASGGIPISAEFDFNQRGPQCWDLEIDCGQESLLLREGASRLVINGHEQEIPQGREYDRVYASLSDLLRRRQSNADLRPFYLVADAFLIGRRTTVPAFHWD